MNEGDRCGMGCTSSYAKHNLYHFTGSKATRSFPIIIAFQSMTDIDIYNTGWEHAAGLGCLVQ